MIITDDQSPIYCNCSDVGFVETKHATKHWLVYSFTVTGKKTNTENGTKLT